MWWFKFLKKPRQRRICIHLHFLSKWGSHWVHAKNIPRFGGKVGDLKKIPTEAHRAHLKPKFGRTPRNLSGQGWDFTQCKCAAKNWSWGNKTVRNTSKFPQDFTSRVTISDHAFMIPVQTEVCQRKMNLKVSSKQLLMEPRCDWHQMNNKTENIIF